MNAFAETVVVEHGKMLLALAQANQALADFRKRAAEDAAGFEASITKLKARIAELEAAVGLVSGAA